MPQCGYKAPRVQVKLNDKSYFKDNVSAGTEEKTQIIEFEHECEERSTPMT